MNVRNRPSIKTTLVALCLASGAWCSGCGHSIHDVYLSDVTAGSTLRKGSPVSAESSQFVILGFAKDTAYVESARSDLMAKCPRGHLEGIVTQFSTDLGFFSWTNRIRMKGTCLVDRHA